jgi:uncharacterized protein involved in exopolysaccharide biosynthesis
MDDYLAMARRRWKVALIPALPALLIGFLISYAFSPKYTSQSLVLVEGQRVPEGYVKPVVTEELDQRLILMQQQIQAHDRLKAMVVRLGLAKEGKELEQMIGNIRQNFTVTPLQSGPAATTPSTSSVPVNMSQKKKRPGSKPDASTPDFPGFYVSFTADDPKVAHEICNGLTSMMLDENIKNRAQLAQGTSDFLNRQVEESKAHLDDLDSKLATFKKQYSGQLPGDADANLKILTGLNSQLDANTQTLTRAQQDKSYAESLLAQQLAVWKSQRSAVNPQTLEEQLVALQNQLLKLRTRYTDEHPDVVKTERDIADLKNKLKGANSSAAGSGNSELPAIAGTEPPEIRQLRQQIHQYEQVIAQAEREHQRLEQQIALYQSRVALSPEVEEQYKQLTRDYDAAQQAYNDLLGKKSQSALQTDMERQQQGEQMTLLNPANLPDSPSFPVRWMFAAGGLGIELAIGLGVALWLELRDQAIRTEQDVQATLQLPMLVAMPWLDPDAGERSEGPSWRRFTLAGG